MTLDTELESTFSLLVWTLAPTAVPSCQRRWTASDAFSPGTSTTLTTRWALGVRTGLFSPHWVNAGGPWCAFCLPFGLIDALSMQQTPAYSRHTLHQDRRADKSGRPLHRHHSLGERHSYNTITHWPQVLCRFQLTVQVLVFQKLIQKNIAYWEMTSLRKLLLMCYSTVAGGVRRLQRLTEGESKTQQVLHRYRAKNPYIKRCSCSVTAEETHSHCFYFHFLFFILLYFVILQSCRVSPVIPCFLTTIPTLCVHSWQCAP